MNIFLFKFVSNELVSNVEVYFNFDQKMVKVSRLCK